MEDERGWTCIPPEQREIHKTTEGASFLIAAPFMVLLALGTKGRPLRPVERTGLLVAAGGALWVDTLLYRQWGRTKKRKKAQPLQPQLAAA